MKAARLFGRSAMAAGVVLLGVEAAAWADETVTISGFAFKPATITVKPGTTVVWVNQDAAPHAVVDKAGKFKSATLNKGDKFTQTFAQTGTIDFFCGIHPSMTGKIMVAP